MGHVSPVEPGAQFELYIFSTCLALMVIFPRAHRGFKGAKLENLYLVPFRHWGEGKNETALVRETVNFV